MNMFTCVACGISMNLESGLLHECVHTLNLPYVNHYVPQFDAEGVLLSDKKERRERIATAVLAGLVVSPLHQTPTQCALLAVTYADLLIEILDGGDAEHE